MVYVPCTPERLAVTNPVPVVAPPLYGVWMYDPATRTQQPIVIGAEGVLIGDVAAAQPRRNPTNIPDKLPGVDFDADLAAEGAGILNIQSVYDIDGVASVNIASHGRFRDHSSRESSGALPARREGRRDSGRGHRRYREHRVRSEHPARHARDRGVRADRARWFRACEGARERGARRQRARRERSARHGAASELAAGHAGAGAHVQRLSCAAPATCRMAAATRSIPSTRARRPTACRSRTRSATFSPDAGETMAETRTRVSCQTDCAALEPSVDVDIRRTCGRIPRRRRRARRSRISIRT